MAPVYSVKLGGGASGVGPVGHLLYTTPAGRLTIIRDLTIVADVVPTVWAWFDSVSGELIHAGAQATQYDSDHWSGRQVLPAAAALSVYVYLGEVWYRASGYDLSA